MPVATDDTRTFESAVELTPDQLQDNLNYFREQGLAAEYEDEGKPEETTTPAPVPEAPAPPAETKPAEGQAPTVPAGEEIDQASRTEWHEAKNDGEKLGRLAKKTKKINELEGTLKQKDGTIDELRRQLEEKNKTVPAPPAAAAAPSLALDPGPPAPPKVEPPKAKEFDKARPVFTPPKYDDFVANDDPIAAYQQASAVALAEHNEKLQDWKDEKRDFDKDQKAAVQAETTRLAQQSTTQQELQQGIQTRLAAVRSAHPDFDQVTSGKFTPVMNYVLRDALEDGFEIGYELTKPENAEALAALRQASQHVEGEPQHVTERRITETIRAIARFEAKQPEKKTPAKPDPTETPLTTGEKKPPVPQRREEATPAPVRSRGAAATRLEDIPEGNYDERKRWRLEHGEL
jgi:hypothetical protein